MPKKFAVLGAFAGVVVGAASLLGSSGTALAGPGGPVQDFDVDANICYGTAPGVGGVCVAGTDTTAASGTQYNVVNVDVGSRLTQPVTYTPTDFPLTPAADGAVTGNVTAVVDAECDAEYRDIVAAPPYTGGVHANWPNGWTPYDLIHEDPPFIGATDSADDSYLLDTKPTPGGIADVIGHAKATVSSVKIQNGGPIDLSVATGSDLPINIVTEQSPYYANLRTTVVLAGGHPAPPFGFLCFDSPLDSVIANTQTGVPATDGLYPRFTVFRSDADLRAGTISVLVDLQCVTVGGPVADADGDCLGDADDAAPAIADGDGDALADGIEAALGTDPADADTDDDGSNDFTELAVFTRPTLSGSSACASPGLANNAIDTDCDGQRDLPENGADEVAGAPAHIADTSVDDNCPHDFNPLQENGDSPPYNVFTPPGAPPYDHTDPSSDSAGDVCDDDDDDDGMTDVAELALAIEPAPAPGASFCEASTGAGDPQNSPSITTNADTDQDYLLDGIECRYLSNPKDAMSRAGDEPSDNLNAEWFWRTEGINTPTGAPGTEVDDLDGDGLSGAADPDADNDALLDGSEVKYYGTDPSNDDTDGDGCTDGQEAGDVNGNRQINVVDLSLTAFAQGPLRTNPAGPGTVDLSRTNRDMVKAANAQINVADIQRTAAVQGNCPPQGGVTIAQDDDGQAP